MINKTFICSGELFNECLKHLMAFNASPLTLQYSVEAVLNVQCTPVLMFFEAFIARVKRAATSFTLSFSGPSV